jgi:hypothetical protein
MAITMAKKVSGDDSIPKADNLARRLFHRVVGPCVAILWLPHLAMLGRTEVKSISGVTPGHNRVRTSRDGLCL